MSASLLSVATLAPPSLLSTPGSSHSSGGTSSPELSALVQKHFDYAAFFSNEVTRHVRRDARDHMVGDGGGTRRRAAVAWHALTAARVDRADRADLAGGCIAQLFRMTELAREWLLFAKDVYTLSDPSDMGSLCVTQRWAQKGMRTCARLPAGVPWRSRRTLVRQAARPGHARTQPSSLR